MWKEVGAGFSPGSEHAGTAPHSKLVPDGVCSQVSEGTHAEVTGAPGCFWWAPVIRSIHATGAHPQEPQGLGALAESECSLVCLTGAGTGTPGCLQESFHQLPSQDMIIHLEPGTLQESFPAGSADIQGWAMDISSRCLF